MPTKQQPSTTARGYGSAHQAERRRWEPQVAAGSVVCWRCGRTIQPGTPWDLGHHDQDRTRYAGPEHRHCNRAAGARRGNRSPKRKRGAGWRPHPPYVTTLRW